tara:strand:+ start:367 stop:1050 length:684 start_codon:yes stop_codon:yes gene_type:complete
MINNKLFLILCLILICILICICYNISINISPKFFHEGYNRHLDYRFQNIENNYNIQEELIKILKFFSDYCKSKNIQFILAHGGLIGYKFNKKLLPWDDDIDIIMMHDEFIKLKNMETKDILIEINPNSKNFSKFDVNNKISGRVISKQTGLFIDITNYYIDNNLIKCKDGHKFKFNDIFPLKKTKIENIDIYVPNNIDNILIKEYGKKVLLPKYKNWHFINNEWIKK